MKEIEMKWSCILASRKPDNSEVYLEDAVAATASFFSGETGDTLAPRWLGY
jgi:hypothetical protein